MTRNSLPFSSKLFPQPCRKQQFVKKNMHEESKNFRREIYGISKCLITENDLLKYEITRGNRTKLTTFHKDQQQQMVYQSPITARRMKIPLLPRAPLQVGLRSRTPELNSKESKVLNFGEFGSE